MRQCLQRVFTSAILWAIGSSSATVWPSLKYYKAYLYIESLSVSFLISFKMEGYLRPDLKKMTMVKWTFVVKI